MEKTESPRVRARNDDAESSLTSSGQQSSAEVVKPKRWSKTRIGAVALSVSLLVGGVTGGLIGYGKGKESNEPEINDLQAELSSSHQNSAKVSDTWRQATNAGFDHAVAIKSDAKGDVKLTLSTNPKDLNDPNACKVTLDVGYEPEISLVTYDASGDRTEATVINRVTDHAGQIALLEEVSRSHEKSGIPC